MLAGGCWGLGLELSGPVFIKVWLDDMRVSSYALYFFSLGAQLLRSGLYVCVKVFEYRGSSPDGGRCKPASFSRLCFSPMSILVEPSHHSHQVPHYVSDC